LKNDGSYRPGKLLERENDLVVVGSRSLFGFTAVEVPVPAGEVTIVVPLLAVPWFCISSQLGDRRTAIVPFWKRKALLQMLEGAGRSVKRRRTLVMLTVGR